MPHGPRRDARHPIRLGSTEGPRGELRDHDFGPATMPSWRAAGPERQSSRRRRESAGNPWRLEHLHLYGFQMGPQLRTRIGERPVNASRYCLFRS